MTMFHVIDDGVVILRSRKGVYRQAKVYRRGDVVYAGHGGGFVRLMAANGTSCPDILWSDLDANGVHVGRIGNPKFAPEVEPFSMISKSASTARLASANKLKSASRSQAL